jgi:hypothetical protein
VPLRGKGAEDEDRVVIQRGLGAACLVLLSSVSCGLSVVGEAAHLMVLLMRARARGREGLAGSKDQDIVPTRRGGLGSEEWHPVDYLCVLYTTTI